MNLSGWESSSSPASGGFSCISAVRRMGLEFKLGSGVLRTVVVRDWKEIGIVAGIIALRAALTFLIHWEIKEEEKQ